MKSDKLDYPKGYKKWLLKNHKVDCHKEQVFYESASAKMKQDFENSDFWIDFSKNLKDYNDQYHQKNGYHLLMYRDKIPHIQIKPYKSFFEKTYRKNVLNNENWPEAPNNDWILLNDYSKINDILRTCIVVKYLDGVQFLVDMINDLGTSCAIDCNYDFEARMDGYYAAHIDLVFPVEIPVGLEVQKNDIHVEIQITTQLQENIRLLLHSHYEKKRKSYEDFDNDWLWDYKSDEFLANNLGHILHYVEGMIMEARERQR
ncbi:hypothetical protein [Methanobacterium formicicum]|jgi:ppGpp synthetase/RelA/SpoT-type nucleotidyltranferase|uniref:protein adenylyltransferase n=1 Tax=Methanobacterium formicicum (strain DSM 3637 / PP1) TaxID=1204725 RepID=K2R0T3_METFP|nr:hypothetical protein [Methanobacterium formicicum]EKF84787.1 hypothetical protein A994_12276 [Methanobacterium formicicum DSM 3637]